MCLLFVSEVFEPWPSLFWPCQCENFTVLSSISSEAWASALAQWIAGLDEDTVGICQMPPKGQLPAHASQMTKDSRKEAKRPNGAGRASGGL
jgi:hypothetical protein